MSREVLGTTEDDREKVSAASSTQQHPWRSASVTDLDAPAAGPPEEAAPEADDDGGGDRSLAGLWAWVDRHREVVLTAAVALVVGALVATGLVEQAGRAERRATVDVLSGLSDLTARGDTAELEMLVVNAGPEPVTVTGAAVPGSTTHLPLPAGPHEVAAGDAATVTVRIPDVCEAAGDGDLRLVVEARDGTPTSVTTGGLGDRLGGTQDALAALCQETTEDLRPVPVWSTLVNRHGDLVVQVHNTRSQDAELTVSGPPGTAVSTEPTLPVVLPAGRMTTVEIRLDVERCTGAAQRADAGTHLDPLLDGEEDLVLWDDAVVTGWFAQQVVRACG